MSSPGSKKTSKMEPKVVLGRGFCLFRSNLDFMQHYDGFTMFLPSRRVAGATFLTKNWVSELGRAVEASKIDLFLFVYRTLAQIGWNFRRGDPVKIFQNH